MAKYFGHEPAWKPAQRAASGFATPQGGPPVPLPKSANPYNKLGRDGQIIPPKSAKNPYPRGRSVPNTPSSMNSSLAAAQAAGKKAAMRLAMRGLLGPLGLAQLLGDLRFGEQWYQEPSGWNTPSGWTVCATPSCGTPAPDYFQWFSAGGCNSFAACPNSQALASIGTFSDLLANWFVPANGNVRNVLLAKCTSGTIGTGSARYTIVRQYRRPFASPGEVWADGRTVPMNVPDPFDRRNPFPSVRELPQYGPKQAPRPLPATMVPSRTYGPTLPPRGVDIPHKLAPPPIGTKEKKWQIPDLYKRYGQLTEFMDFLDCLAKSIPGKPCRGLPLHEKVACVVKNEAKINMPESIACMFTEGGQDAAHRFPKIFGNPSDNPYYKRPVGPSTGFGFHPRAPSMTPI